MRCVFHYAYVRCIKDRLPFTVAGRPVNASVAVVAYGCIVTVALKLRFPRLPVKYPTVRVPVRVHAVRMFARFSVSVYVQLLPEPLSTTDVIDEVPRVLVL